MDSIITFARHRWTVDEDGLGCYALPAGVLAGNVRIKRAPWNREWIDELVNFPPESGGHDDQVDAASGAFNKLVMFERGPAAPPRGYAPRLLR